MKKTFKFLALFSLVLILIIPVLSFAQPLVPDCVTNPATNQCEWGFNEFLKLINNVIWFILFRLAIPIAAIMFAYAGFLMITAGGEAAGARTKAKGIFMNALLGLVIAAGAWLIIRTILSILGYQGAWIGF